MKETIKKSFVGGLVFLFTVIIGGIVYATTVGTVTTGQTLTADMWNYMAGNYDYSTNEVNTGKKWIDGKPIYRKVIDAGSGDDESIALNIPNISKIWVESFFTIQTSGSIEPTSFYSSDATENFIRLSTTSVTFYARDGVAYSNKIVILNYTKTTD